MFPKSTYQTIKGASWSSLLSTVGNGRIGLSDSVVRWTRNRLFCFDSSRPWATRDEIEQKQQPSGHQLKPRAGEEGSFEKPGLRLPHQNEKTRC